jgi:hypothetical protein
MSHRAYPRLYGFLLLKLFSLAVGESDLKAKSVQMEPKNMLSQVRPKMKQGRSFNPPARISINTPIFFTKPTIRSKDPKTPTETSPYPPKLPLPVRSSSDDDHQGTSHRIHFEAG